MLKNLPSSFAILAGFFAALGTLFFIVGAHTCYRNYQFAGDVVRVTGIVTHRYFTVSHGRHGSSTSYHVNFRFFEADGSGYGSSTTVVRQTYYALTEQGPVPVKYLPHIPTINRIDLPAEDANYQATAWIFLAVGGGFGGCGWFVFIGLERLIFYRRWLRKCGNRCTGKVDEIDASSISVNHTNQLYITYSYTDSMGRKHQDSSQCFPPAKLEAWKEGDPITVFYDPRDSSKSTVDLDNNSKSLPA